MSARLLLALACLLTATPAVADSAGQCLKLFYIKDYLHAVEPCRQAADAGDNQAQYVLGLMFDKGHGVKRDSKQARVWYSKAAKQGYAAASYKLQILQDEATDDWQQKYLESRKQTSGKTAQEITRAEPPAAISMPPVAEKISTPAAPAAEAIAPPATPARPVLPVHYSADELLFRQYMTDAEAGDSHARYLLGLMFHEGVGVEKDDLQALDMFTMAAGQGLTEAQYTLGLIYYQGTGIDRDENKAKQWLEKAAQRGEANAQYCLGLLYAESSEHKDMAQAAAWWRKAAKQGHAQAQHNLAVLYLKGGGIDSDSETALNWFLREAEQGDPEVQFNLARIYSETRGIKPSGSDAANWYFRAGETWLNRGDIQQAQAAVEKIRQLDSLHHLDVPNTFLAEVLDKRIRQVTGSDSPQPVNKSATLPQRYSSL